MPKRTNWAPRGSCVDKTCSFKGCTRPMSAKRLCKAHYEHWRRTGKLDAPVWARRVNQGRSCSFDGCKNPARSHTLCEGHSAQMRAHGKLRPLYLPREYPIVLCSAPSCARRATAKGLCEAHRKQVRKSTPLRRLRTEPSRVFHDGVSWVVELLNTRGFATGRARISRRDKNRCAQFRWQLNGRGRPVGTAYATCNKLKMMLHRFIMQPEPTEEVDHWNGDGLDCRRSNMRVVTRGQNAQNLSLRTDNKTGYRNVTYDVARRRYRVEVRVHGRTHYGGRFKSLHEAAAVAFKMRQRLFTHHNEARHVRRKAK